MCGKRFGIRGGGRPSGSTEPVDRHALITSSKVYSLEAEFPTA